MFLTGKGSEAGGCRREKPRADGFFSSRRAKSLGRPKPGGGSREFPKTRAQTDFGKCPMSRPGARTPKVKECASPRIVIRLTRARRSVAKVSGVVLEKPK